MAFLEQLAGRQPGEPRKPEVPGAPPTASQPADKVNPPGVNTGPEGRPPKAPPAFPGGAGASLPGVSKPVAQPPPAQPPSGSAPPPQGTPAAPGAAPVDPTMGVPLVQNFDKVPNSTDIANVPEGVTIQTPYGTMDRDGKLTLSPEGEMKYKEAIVQRRKKLGPHPFHSDPSAPQMDIELGKPMVNPFTGQWVDPD